MVVYFPFASVIGARVLLRVHHLYTAICVKRIFNVNFTRGQGTFGPTGPCGRNVVDSLTAGFGHRDSQLIWLVQIV